MSVSHINRIFKCVTNKVVNLERVVKQRMYFISSSIISLGFTYNNILFLYCMTMDMDIYNVH